MNISEFFKKAKIKELNEENEKLTKFEQAVINEIEFAKTEDVELMDSEKIKNLGKNKVGRTEKIIKIRNKSNLQDEDNSEDYEDFENHEESNSIEDKRYKISAHKISTPTKIHQKEHYFGHRDRLKQKFLTGNAEVFQNYELLELLLTFSIPRGDVKPLAKELFGKFQSFRSIFLADQQSLTQVKGIGNSTLCFLRTIYEVSCRIAKEEIKENVLLDNPERVFNYCKLRMSGLNYEQFRVIFLNRKNKLILDEIIQSGTIDKAMVFPREIVKRAIELGAGAMILIHNHPSGDPTPSKSDIDATINIQKAAKLMDILLYDHIIIGKNQHYSMRSNKNL